MFQKYVFVCAVWLISVTPIFGASTEKPFGIYFSTLGDPVPSLFGVNAAYNLSSQFRANVGVGWLPLFVDNSYSVGAGIKYLFLENSAFTPLVGFGLAVTRVESQNLSNLISDLFQTPRTKADSQTYLSANVSAGVDWQTGIGFNLGGGVNYAYIAGYSSFFPYLNLGWFF